MEEDYIIIDCPNCSDSVFILKKELNCLIFRHGVYKNNMENIDPHLCKNECDRLFKEELIYGCGKPFKLEKDTDKYLSYICDYI